MSIPIRRARHLVLATSAVVLIAGAQLGAPGTGARARGIHVSEFLIGLGCVESAGRYDARNPSSGAYGKYQIMPFNWPVWASRYLGNSRARQTPRNQELVAHAKVLDLKRWLGSWRRSAYWWLTGGTETNRDRWSPIARWYVNKVIAFAHAARTAEGLMTIPANCLSTPSHPDGRDPATVQPIARGDRLTTVWLNVRVGPGLRHERFTTVPPRTPLVVLGSGQDGAGRLWYRVRIPDGRRGWVAGWFTVER